MTLDDICLLFSYDRWANRRVFHAVSKLSTEQFTRDLGTSFSSIRDTLLHVIGGEWIWLQYWPAMPVPEERVAELKTRRDEEFLSERFRSAEEVNAKWLEVEQQQMKFLEDLTEEALHQPIEFRAAPIELVDLMLHVINHSTYHRGQIALMLRQVGAVPIATDYHVFRVEQGRASCTAAE